MLMKSVNKDQKREQKLSENNFRLLYSREERTLYKSSAQNRASDEKICQNTHKQQAEHLPAALQCGYKEFREQKLPKVWRKS